MSAYYGCGRISPHFSAKAGFPKTFGTPSLYSHVILTYQLKFS